MKPKSTLFISVTLTAFVLALLAGAVSTINTAKTDTVASAAGSTDVSVTESPIQLDPTATQVGPEQAASIAAQFLNRSDLYSVESTTINGIDAYKVVFSSGDVVYVGLDGMVIGTESLQPTIIVNAPSMDTPNNRHDNNGHGDDDHDRYEHEEYEDDDD